MLSQSHAILKIFPEQRQSYQWKPLCWSKHTSLQSTQLQSMQTFKPCRMYAVQMSGTYPAFAMLHHNFVFDVTITSLSTSGSKSNQCNPFSNGTRAHAHAQNLFMECKQGRKQESKTYHVNKWEFLGQCKDQNIQVNCSFIIQTDHSPVQKLPHS